MRFGDDIIHQGLILLRNNQTLLWVTRAPLQKALLCSSALVNGSHTERNVFSKNTEKV